MTGLTGFLTARKDGVSMKKNEMKKPPLRPLTPTELSQVAGGEIVSPRDAATGLPTGKRSHGALP
jgi:hypothetical protein